MTVQNSTLRVAVDSRAAVAGSAAGAAAIGGMGTAATKSQTQLAALTTQMNATKVAGAGLAAMLLGPLGLGLGGAAILLGATKIGGGFEQTMQELRGVTGATADEFERLQGRARDLGAVTRFSAREAGEGLLFLARAGFTTSDALDAVGATLDLAAAGNLDLGRAADFASNIVSQFGLSAEETVRVADTLVKVSNSANVNVTQLAESMKFAGPVAGALGISIEETAAAIGVLGDSGIQASMAGTNMRGIFAGLLDPTGKATNAIEAMGLSLEDLDPSANSIIDIFAKFKENSLSAAQAVAIFGRRNAAAALVLTRSSQRIAELNEMARQAQGEAKKMADIMNDSLFGAFRNLKSIIEELLIQFGERGWNGALRRSVETMTSAFRIIAGYDSAMDRANKTAVRFAASLKFVSTLLTLVIGLKVAAWFFAVAKGIQAAAFSSVVLASNLAIVAGIFTGLLALDVGNWLFNNFAIVQKVGAGVVASFTGWWILLKAGFREVGIFIADEVNSVIFMITTALGLALTKMKAALDAIPKNILFGASGLPGGVGTIARLLLGAKNEGAEAIDKAIAQLKILETVSKSFDAKATRKASRSQFGSDRDDMLKVFAMTIDQIEKDVAEGAFEGGKNYADEFGKGLSETFALIFGPSGEASSKVQAEMEALNKAIMDGLIKTKEDIDREIAGIIASLEGFDKVSATIGSIREETRLAGMSQNDRERDGIMSRARMDLSDSLLGGPANPGFFGAVSKLKELNQEVDKLFKARDLREVAEQIGSSFSDAFAKALTGVLSLKDAFKQLYEEILNMMIRKAVVNPIADFVTGADAGSLLSRFLGGGRGTDIFAPRGSTTSSARGNIFGFAGGGVLQSPSVFPVTGGLGTAAERGKEGIFPLGRTATGELGVKGIGGGGGFTMNVYTNDANSFRRSEGQIRRMAQRMTGTR